MLTGSAPMSLAWIQLVAVLYIMANGQLLESVYCRACISVKLHTAVEIARITLPASNAIVFHLVLVVCTEFWHLYIVSNQKHCVCTGVWYCSPASLPTSTFHISWSPSSSLSFP
uniref:Secreted protein n=1 Tax=Eutreptiella gymnastica TaxID=73025 RepID=A0A7S1J348_9EUGL|mmetsp:Transcript_62416/g.111204  ORF Transcript_62416/g.111204 Transcript_62416/m.111204 type:complete len:114 (+) Transcript_62416:624-965(+)